VYNNLSLV